MSWSLLIQIIAQYGLPMAEKLFQKVNSGNPPTIEDFTELRQLASKSESDLLKSRLTAAGIPLDSEQAKTLLALVK